MYDHIVQVFPDPVAFKIVGMLLSRVQRAVGRGSRPGLEEMLRRHRAIARRIQKS
jgi:hypothetical protein